MRVTFTLNGAEQRLDVRPGATLLEALRSEAVFSVKHGCESGECGACAVLVDGELRPSCVMLAAQADGRRIVTAESFGTPSRLGPVQQAFLDCGGVQCGYCTPAMLLATTQLLQANPSPTEQEARDCLSGVLCRCTGYVKPVEAILRAAAVLRGEEVAPVDRPPSGRLTPDGAPASGDGHAVAVLEQKLTDTSDPLKVVGRPQPKLDGPRLVAGRPAFVDDVEVRGLLHARLLLSPHAHARITRIDASRARALPGVHAVLTHQDVPRVSYTSAGQSWPEPSPHDMRSLDDKVRFVGDRVAAVAAETPEIAARACQLIEVEYEVLPAIVDLEQATAADAPVIHDEPDSRGFGHFDFAHNIAAQITATHGDVTAGFAEADLIVERTYRVPKVQQVSIEPHVTITYLDEDDRLVVRTSTQVPFHVRRIIAPLIGLPMSRIRVIKPRIGGGFGGKQEVLIEDICAHLTLATGRPVKLEYTRGEEFTAARSRHPQVITIKTGVKRDGTLTANEMRVLADTGAYGSHALTVQSNTGVKVLPLYRAPHLRFECTTVYTNLPPAGAFRGYGVPQGAFALESHMDEVAGLLGLDPWEFRAKNWVRVGDVNPLSKKMNEGKEGYAQEIHSCGLPECVAKASAAVGYGQKRPATGPKRRGVGGAIAMQGSAIPGVDMGGAILKLNDDGSFNLLVGATDLGTGADTVMAQIAAEVLGCRASDILVYPSDTDLTPFDTGAYASSTTFISGMAVKKAAEAAAWEIRKVAARLLNLTSAEPVRLEDRHCTAPDGRSVTLMDVALHSLHVSQQQQIMGHASAVSLKSPPPFCAQFAEVEVDTETGQITVLQMASAVDCGRAMNPVMAEGQIEGAATQALGYGHCEEM
ncbi:MAG TPA: molybdopterin cofactor-binding domain-containing protein, partial [Symbiobacteriaceae bacterium]|nr:molybdopterin cofactor-binding domain-containing protein [Symbiobacteriaceae bacterium]